MLLAGAARAPASECIHDANATHKAAVAACHAGRGVTTTTLPVLEEHPMPGCTCDVACVEEAGRIWCDPAAVVAHCAPVDP